MSTFRTGEPAWIELSAADPDTVTRFYCDLLGWTVRDERLDGGVYRMCSVDGHDVAGISEAAGLHGGRPHGWITYFAVDDLATTAALAVALGGEMLMEARYAPAAGSCASFMDPFGAVFGLYQGEARAGVEMLNQTGSLAWNELGTGEPDQSVAYYQALFGFEIEHRDSLTHRPYTVLQLGQDPVAGVLALENEWPNQLPSRWIAYLVVTHLDDALDTVVALGGSTTIGPFENDHGRFHLIRDPGGNSLCLIQLRSNLRNTPSAWQTKAAPR